MSKSTSSAFLGELGSSKSLKRCTHHHAHGTSYLYARKVNHEFFAKVKNNLEKSGVLPVQGDTSLIISAINTRNLISHVTFFLQNLRLRFQCSGLELQSLAFLLTNFCLYLQTQCDTQCMYCMTI